MVSALRGLGAPSVCWLYGPRRVRDDLQRRGVTVVSLRAPLNPDSADEVARRVRRAGARVVLCNVMRLESRTVAKLRAAGLVVTAVVEGSPPRALDHVFDVVERPELMILSPRLTARRRRARRGTAPLLLTMGGCDARGLTPRLVRWLGRLAVPPELRVVVGGLFDHERRLQLAMERYPAGCELERAPDQERLFHLMAVSRAAITHGGDTLYELACLGVPTAAVCPSARQLRVARRFASAHAVMNLGVHRALTRPVFQKGVRRLLDDPVTRRQLARCGRALVDGRGAQRVASTLAQLTASRTGVSGSDAGSEPAPVLDGRANQLRPGAGIGRS